VRTRTRTRTAGAPPLCPPRGRAGRRAKGGLCGLVFLALAACDMNIRPDDAELRTGMTQEEMDAAPGHHEMKAAILADVRKWRMLERRLEEGRAFCPDIVYKEKAPHCKVCEELMEVYSLKKDLADQPYRVEETAFYCRKESKYFYHYLGGRKKMDVWLGPYAIERKRVKPDNH
jgi:hypothetical protein